MLLGIKPQLGIKMYLTIFVYTTIAYIQSRVSLLKIYELKVEMNSLHFYILSFEFWITFVRRTGYPYAKGQEQWNNQITKEDKNMNVLSLSDGFDEEDQSHLVSYKKCSLLSIYLFYNILK